MQATCTAGWAIETETRKTLVPSGGFTANGKQRMRPVYHRYIHLSRTFPSGHHSYLTFCVTKNKTGVVVSDTREMKTGAAPVYNRQFMTAEYAKPGKKKSMTPIAWLADVSPRLISRELGLQALNELGA